MTPDKTPASIRVTATRYAELRTRKSIYLELSLPLGPREEQRRGIIVADRGQLDSSMRVR